MVAPSNADDDDTFVNYIATTVDTGPWLLLSVLLYSTLCIFIIPILVVLGEKRERRRMDRKKWKEESNNTDSSGAENVEHNLENREGIEVELNGSTDNVAIIDLNSTHKSRPKRRQVSGDVSMNIYTLLLSVPGMWPSLPSFFNLVYSNHFIAMKIS